MIRAKLSFCVLLCLLVSAVTRAEWPQESSWEHASELVRSGPETGDYLLGLGALQKIGGRWRHKQSEFLHGELSRVTWQVNDSYTADEAYDWALEQLPAAAEQLYACEGRSCGSSAQWADRVFQQRLLYGHDERQRYSAWRWQQPGGHWYAVLYAVDRANRRHYLHLDLLWVAD